MGVAAGEGHAHSGNKHLAHHFDTPGQQFASAKLGMWIFLATEILLFGGLFCAYAVYRASHPEVFIYAHRFLDVKLGGINTVVLLCSSLTMAWAVRCAQLGKQKGLKVLLALTLLGGFGFLGIKAVEYEHKWKHGLLWGKSYRPVGVEHAGGHPDAHHPLPEGEPGGGPIPGTTGSPKNVQLFFGIYFLMTGLHGIHVIGGMGAISWLLFRASRGAFGSEYYTPVDLVGLYWHVVDLIWIYLFPLLYLIH